MFRTASCLVVIFTITAANVHGDVATFSHHFNLYDDYTQYLDSTTNAFIETETARPRRPRYWRPQKAAWAEVVYHFPVGFEIETANLNVNLLTADSVSRALVDVSTDGVNWTNVGSTTPIANIATYTGPGDITPFVQGGETLFVRSRLYAPLSQGRAQFLRSHTNDSEKVFRLDVTAVPEPSSIILVTVGALSLFGYALHQEGKRR